MTKTKLNLQKYLTKRNKLIVIAAVIGLISFFFAKEMTLYVFFIIFNAVIIYYSKLYHVPFDVSPLFFLQTVITRYYGLKMTTIFIFLSYIVPKLIAGSGMNVLSYAFIALSLTTNAISLFLPATMSLLVIGYLSSIIQYAGGIGINMTMKPFLFAAVDGVANVLNNLVWFLIFSDLIAFLFGY